MGSPLDGGLISRAPKGDGGLNSRACLRILMVEPLPVLSMAALSMAALSMAALMVEHLKVLMVEREIDGGLNSRAPTGPYGRAPKG